MTTHEAAEQIAAALGATNRLGEIEATIEAAVETERASIAQAIDDNRHDHEESTGHVAGQDFCEDYGCSTLLVIANSIRARKDKRT